MFCSVNEFQYDEHMQPREIWENKVPGHQITLMNVHNRFYMSKSLPWYRPHTVSCGVSWLYLFVRFLSLGERHETPVPNTPLFTYIRNQTTCGSRDILWLISCLNWSLFVPFTYPFQLWFQSVLWLSCPKSKDVLLALPSLVILMNFGVHQVSITDIAAYTTPNKGSHDSGGDF